MAITLNGSTGISSPGGDTSTSLSTGLLTVTGSTVPVDGMYLPTTNTLAWATASTERLRLDASGNLGLGVTPSAWLIYKAFDIGPYSSLSAAGAEVEVNSNAAYLAGTGWTYKQTAFASQYRQTVGQHRWYTAASGTAGNAISFTQAMTLDAGGNLGVGTSSPSALRVTLEGNGNQLRIRNSTTRYRSDYAVNAVGTAEINVFDDSGGVYMPLNLAANYLSFQTGSGSVTERARIDSSGRFLVGTTSAIATNFVGNFVGTEGVASTATASGGAGFLSRLGAGNGSGYHYFGQDSSANSKFYVVASGAIYSTSTSITAISDISLKENIRPLETGLAEVLALQPRKFDWKNGDGFGIAGFIAQEVEPILPDLVSDYKYNDEETKKGLKMGDMIPTLVKAIQELTARLEALEGAK